MASLPVRAGYINSRKKHQKKPVAEPVSLYLLMQQVFMKNLHVPNRVRLCESL